jgi:hypothetical protein
MRQVRERPIINMSLTIELSKKGGLMNDKLKPWIPMIITVGGTLASAIVPTIQGWVVMHPTVAVLAGGIWAAYKGLSKSPLSPQ